ncbi:MAG: hypothetical protein ONB23_05815 [candidate division KSB1 bacterium]|nr:hypothetical protein [candidate division KSB1 bacterium]
MPEYTADLRVNGQSIPLNEFVNRLLSNIICAMVASLKGTSEPKIIEIRVELRGSDQ